MKSWREKRLRKEIRTSASQHETFELCARKWWLDKVRGLGSFDGSTKSQVFGTVLHSVCERFLSADDLGRTPEGNEVDLYPEGWYIAINDYTGEVDGEVSPAEQDLIKRLIAKAIESGVLERRPGREIEKSFRRSILIVDGVNIQIEGFIDCAFVEFACVDDHKTAKTPRYWKSANKLKESLQMLIYAAQMLFERRERGLPDPEYVTLRHNQYCTDLNNPIVRKTETTVTVEEIEKAWNERVLVNAANMQKLRSQMERWSDIPEPKNMASACNAYGGCAYMRICHGMETEDAYEKILDKTKGEEYSALTVNGNAYPENKGNTMSTLSERMAKMKQAGSAATVAGPAPAINPPTPPAQPAAAQSPTPAPAAPVAAPTTAAPAVLDLNNLGESPDGMPLSVPPWVNPASPTKINHGLGFNNLGGPDAVANMFAKRDGRPTYEMFDTEVIGDGLVLWTGKDGTPAAGMQGVSPFSLAAIRGQVVAQERVSPPAPVAAPVAPAPAPAPAPSPATEAEAATLAGAPDEANEEPEESRPATEGFNPTRRGGRPKKGFTLAINCYASPDSFCKGSGHRAHDLNAVLEQIKDDILLKHRETNPSLEYFELLDPFRRRDEVGTYAKQLVDRFGSDFVIVSGLGTGQCELKTLVDALRPLAGVVLAPVGG